MIKGTAKQLISNGTKVNGRFVDAIALGQMLKFGLISEDGKSEKPAGQTGRAATIYVLTDAPNFKVTYSA